MNTMVEPRAGNGVIRGKKRIAKAQQTPEEKALQAIECYIKNPPENSRVFTITPKIAEILLDKYGRFKDKARRNRRLKDKKIMQYARSMKEGDWGMTGETIVFSDANILRDGQNRLNACIRAKTPFKVHVIFGIPDGNFKYMDSGAGRSSTDILHIAGHTDSSLLTAAVKWAEMTNPTDGDILRRINYRRGSGGLENYQVLALVEGEYARVKDFLKPARAAYDKYGLPKGMVAGLLFNMFNKNPLKCMEFIQGIEDGMRHGEFKPLGLVVARITELESAKTGQLKTQIKAGLFVNAWNLFVKGKRGNSKSIIYNYQEPFPEILG